MEIKAIARKWGRSIAVVIPREVVEKQRISQDEEIVIEIKKPVLAGEVFGMLKGWKRSTQEIKDEMRRGWESASDRERWKK